MLAEQGGDPMGATSGDGFGGGRGFARPQRIALGRIQIKTQLVRQLLDRGGDP